MEYNNLTDQEPMPYSGPVIGQMFWCPECGNMARYSIPVEPVYFLDEVYKLVPFPSLIAAKRYLDRRKEEYPPQYLKVRAKTGYKSAGGARYKRVLSASEIRRLRNERVVSEYG